MPETVVNVLKEQQKVQLVQRLRAGQMWDNPQRFVFTDEVGQHIARNTLYMNYKRALKQAGLPETLRFHDLRHNFATLLFEAGVEPLIAMKILGHTDYQTTANIYTHLNSEMMKKSSVDMEEVFRRKQEAKGVLVKAKSAKEKRSRKPAVDASLPWAGRF